MAADPHDAVVVKITSQNIVTVQVVTCGDADQFSTMERYFKAVCAIVLSLA